MESQYGIAVTNKFDLFIDDDLDPFEILRQQEEAAKKSKDKTAADAKASKSKSAKSKKNKNNAIQAQQAQTTKASSSQDSQQQGSRDFNQNTQKDGT